VTTSPIRVDESLVGVAEVHARRFDDEVVILDLAGGDYYALNAAGACIWEQLVAGRTPAEIARVLASEFQVEPERALTDCIALAGELIARGLLRRRT
jgi:hypothetical protein